jgi:hypothetical protein
MQNDVDAHDTAISGLSPSICVTADHELPFHLADDPSLDTETQKVGDVHETDWGMASWPPPVMVVAPDHCFPFQVRPLPNPSTAMQKVEVGQETPSGDPVGGLTLVGVAQVPPVRMSRFPHPSATAQKVADGQETVEAGTPYQPLPPPRSVGEVQEAPFQSITPDPPTATQKVADAQDTEVGLFAGRRPKVHVEPLPVNIKPETSAAQNVAEEQDSDTIQRLPSTSTGDDQAVPVQFNV